MTDKELEEILYSCMKDWKLDINLREIDVRLQYAILEAMRKCRKVPYQKSKR